MRMRDANLTDVIGEEGAARTGLVRMTPRKWRLIRTCEAIMRLLWPILPSPRAGVKSNAESATILAVEYVNSGELTLCQCAWWGTDSEPQRQCLSYRFAELLGYFALQCRASCFGTQLTSAERKPSARMEVPTSHESMPSLS